MSATEGNIVPLHLFRNGAFQAERFFLTKRRRKARMKRVLTVLAIVMCCTIEGVSGKRGQVPVHYF